MHYLDNMIKISILIDDLAIESEKEIAKLQLSGPKMKRKGPLAFLPNESMTIVVLFHLSNHRNMKYFDLVFVKEHLQAELPRATSHNLHVELVQAAKAALAMYLKTRKLGACPAISFMALIPMRALCSDDFSYLKHGQIRLDV